MGLNLKIFKEASLNLVFLGLTQALNYIVPILMIPYIIKYVGIESFGKISIIQAILFYSTYIVNYGFNYSGTIKISSDRESNHTLLFSSIVFTKIILSFISSFLSLVILFFFKVTINEFITIYLSFLFYLLGNSIFPEWYFHRIQKLKYSFYVILIWKVLYIILVVLFISNKGGYLIVVFIDGVLYFVSAIGCLFFVKRKFKLELVWVNRKLIKNQLISNWDLFLSMAFTTFYTKGNFLFLGLCSTQLEVAIYAIAERYVFMINGLLSLINRVILPYLTFYKSKSTQEYFALTKRILYIVIIIGTILCLGNYLLDSYIASVLSILYKNELISLLSILAFSFVSSSFCTFVTTVLIIENRSKTINKINVIGLIIGVFWVMPLTFIFHGKGLAFGFVTNSFTLVFLNAIVLNKLFKVLKMELYNYSNE